MSKRLFLPAVLAFALAINIPAFAQVPASAYSYSTVHLDHMGVIGELAYYKQTAENHAIRVFNNQQIPDSIKSQVIIRYNDLRVSYEQLVLQLLADLHAKKRLWYFKNLDKYFKYGKVKNNKRIHHFIANWEMVLKTHESFVGYPVEALLKDLSTVPRLDNDELDLTEEQDMDIASGVKLNPLDPLGSASSLFNIYKKISAKNALRTQNITEMLYDLRLRHPAELISDEGPEPVEVKMENDEN